MNPGTGSIKIRLAIVVLACWAFPITGAATEHDPGAWITFSATDAFQTDARDSRWHYWFDAQARYFDLGSGVNQWLARPGIGYDINENVMGWVGYARFRTRNSAGVVVDENRFWQQVNWSAGKWIEGRVSIRVRLEQRSVSVGDDTRLVLRFMAKYVRPIGANAGTNLAIGIEPFVDLRDTDWGGESGLGQNRVTIAFTRRLSERVSIEAGYMNQYIWRDGAENRNNHFGVLSFKVKL
jgi:hypothetical protein